MLFKIEWVKIPAGKFQMGDSAEGVHTVSLDSFYMSKTLVTFHQYDLFCEDTGREKPGDKGWGRGDRPVINVSWHDADDFCKWLSAKMGENVHLPTEAQWEYACRAGTTGDHYGILDEIAWYKENSEGKTHPVAQKNPMLLDYTICWGMCGSGVMIFMGNIPRKQLQTPTVLKVARTGFYAAAVGSTTAGLSGLLTASGSIPPTATTLPAFAWPEVKNSRQSKQEVGRSEGNEQPRKGGARGGEWTERSPGGE
jgi:hypothetical protein